MSSGFNGLKDLTSWPRLEWKQEALSAGPLCPVASEGAWNWNWGGRDFWWCSWERDKFWVQSVGWVTTAVYRWYARPAISARDYGISHWNERLFLLWRDSWLARSLILQYIRGAQTTGATRFFVRFAISTAFGVIWMGAPCEHDRRSVIRFNRAESWRCNGWDYVALNGRIINWKGSGKKR